MARDMKHRDFRSEAFHDLATALGQFALAWNDLHLSLETLFQGLLGKSNALISGAIWNSLASDAAQRDMLKSLANLDALGHNVPDRARNEINFILNQAERLRGRRNDAIHAPFVSSAAGEIVPFIGTGHKKAKNFGDKNVLKELRRCYDATIILSDYANNLSAVLLLGLNDWPARPNLPNNN